MKTKFKIGDIVKVQCLRTIVGGGKIVGVDIKVRESGTKIVYHTQRKILRPEDSWSMEESELVAIQQLEVGTEV